MAVDALEIDDSADPTSALEEILDAPERLKDLDLDAFAEELQRQVNNSRYFSVAGSCRLLNINFCIRVDRSDISLQRFRVSATKASRCTTFAPN